jgi:hypothetical protein
MRAALACLVLASAVTAVHAAEGIATAVAVRPQATGLLNGSTIVLNAADDLFEGQKIVTGAQGQVQIVFADDTHMVVGPGSSLVIDKYLMRNGGTASALAVSALGGTFRFITGKSNKNAYKIDTPTGTIGVRGTKFDLTVTTRKTNVLLFEGEVTYCPNTGSCESVKGSCEIGLGESSNAQVVSKGTSNHSSNASQFIYAKSQNSLLTDFKVNASPCNTAAADTSTPNQPPPAPDPGPSKPQGKPDPLPDPLPDK